MEPAPPRPAPWRWSCSRGRRSPSFVFVPRRGLLHPPHQQPWDQQQAEGVGKEAAQEPSRALDVSQHALLLTVLFLHNWQRSLVKQTPVCSYACVFRASRKSPLLETIHNDLESVNVLTGTCRQQAYCKQGDLRGETPLSLCNKPRCATRSSQPKKAETWKRTRNIRISTSSCSPGGDGRTADSWLAALLAARVLNQFCMSPPCTSLCAPYRAVRGQHPDLNIQRIEPLELVL